MNRSWHFLTRVVLISAMLAALQSSSVRAAESKTVEFVNDGKVTVIVFMLDQRGNEVDKGRIKPGTTEKFQTNSGTVWRFKRGSGTTVGEFTWKRGVATRYVVPLLPGVTLPPSKSYVDLEFVNEGDSVVQVFQVDGSGIETDMGEIKPSQSGTFQTRPGTMWRFKRRGRPVSDLTWNEGDERRFVVPRQATRPANPNAGSRNNTSGKPAAEPESSPPEKNTPEPDAPLPDDAESLSFVNNGMGAVKVFYLDENSREVEFGSIPAGKTEKFDSYSGTVWRFKREGKTVGELAWSAGDARTYQVPLKAEPSGTANRSASSPSAPQPAAPLPAAPLPDDAVTLSFVNDGTSAVTVFYLDENNREVEFDSIAARKTEQFDSYAGTVWRFKREGKTVGELAWSAGDVRTYQVPLKAEPSGTANSPANAANPRSSPAEEAAPEPDVPPSDDAVTLSFVNDGTSAVTVFYLDENNREVEFDSIAARKTEQFDSYAGTVWRFKRDGKTVGELAWSAGDARSYLIPLKAEPSGTANTTDSRDAPDDLPADSEDKVPPELADLLMDGAELSVELATKPGSVFRVEFLDRADIDNLAYDRQYTLDASAPASPAGPAKATIWTVRSNPDGTVRLTTALDPDGNPHLCVRNGELAMGNPPDGGGDLPASSFWFEKSQSPGVWLIATSAGLPKLEPGVAPPAWRAGVRLNFRDAPPEELKKTEHSADFKAWQKKDQPSIPPSKTAVAGGLAEGFTGKPLPDEYSRYGYNAPRMNPLRLHERGSIEDSQPYLFSPIDPNAQATFYLYNNYRVPMDMWVVTVKTQLSDARQMVYTSEEEFANSFNNTIGISGNAGFGGWGVGYGYDTTAGSTREQMRSQSQTLRVETKWYADYWMIVDKSQIKLSQELVGYLLDPAFGGDQESYNEFFQIFGTHYPISTLYGGRGLETQMNSAESASQALTSSLSEAHSGSASAGTFAKVDGRYSYDSSKMAKKLQSTATESATFTADGGTGNSISTFQRGELDQNVPIKVDLREVSEIIHPELAGPLNRWQRQRLNAIRAELPGRLKEYLQPPKKANVSLLPVLAEMRLDAVKVGGPGEFIQVSGTMKMTQDEKVAQKIEAMIKDPSLGDPDKVDGAWVIFDSKLVEGLGGFYNSTNEVYDAEGLKFRSGADQVAAQGIGGNGRAWWPADNRIAYVMSKPSRPTAAGAKADALDYTAPPFWVYMNLQLKAGDKTTPWKRIVKAHAVDSKRETDALFASGGSPDRAYATAQAAKCYGEGKEFTCGIYLLVPNARSPGLDIKFKVTPVPFSVKQAPDGLPDFPRYKN